MIRVAAYIVRHRKRYSREQITKKLMDADYSPHEISRAFRLADSWHFLAYGLIGLFGIAIFLGVNIAFPLNLAGRVSGNFHCDTLGDYERNWCLFDAAKTIGRSDICPQITQADLRSYCLALTTHDPERCTLIVVDKIRQECLSISSSR